MPFCKQSSELDKILHLALHSLNFIHADYCGDSGETKF